MSLVTAEQYYIILHITIVWFW